MIFVVGGGGKLKDTDAVLVVTVPTGSTVTATKGSTTLTPTMWVKAADASLDCAIFSIPASQFDSTTPWTVTATNGTDTATDTIIISAADAYDITLTYVFWIHKVGVGLLSPFTGSFGSGSDTRAGIINSNEISFNYASGYACFRINETIDLSGFSSCIFEYQKELVGYGGGSDAKTGVFGFSSSNAFGTYEVNPNFTVSQKPAIATMWTETSIDVSSLSSALYFKFCGWNNGYVAVRNLRLKR